MKVDLEKETVEDIETEKETGELPTGSETIDNEPAAAEIASQESDRVRKIEIENAELRGKNSALESFRTSAPSVDSTTQARNQWKQTVLGDMNGMSDDDFRSKYKFEKYQATAAILENEFTTSDTKNKEQIAELRAENRLVAKYGKDFGDVRDKVDEMVAMASPEIRQDPKKLEKFMETAYLAASKEKPATPIAAKSKGNDMQRRIVNSLERPTPVAQGGQRTAEAKDTLAPEYQKLGRAFGLTSEKERKALLETNYVPMELGNGLVYRDPSRGVEKIEAAK